MARPSKNDIDSGIQGWDGKMDDNDEALFNAPLPIHEHTGDESDVATDFPPGSYDRCMVWVDHTTLGWSLYVSDGSAWNRLLSVDSIATIAQLTNSNGTGNDAIVAVPAVNGSGATTAQEAAIDDNFRDVSDKIEEIRQALLDHGLIT